MMRVTVAGSRTMAARPSTELPHDGGTAEFARHLRGTASSGRTMAAPPLGTTALLAIQEARPPRRNRGPAIRRGEAVLDGLADLEAALLGDIDLSQAADRLRLHLEEQVGATDDSSLDAILEAIELRARVELAKLEVRLGPREENRSPGERDQPSSSSASTTGDHSARATLAAGVSTSNRPRPRPASSP